MNSKYIVLQILSLIASLDLCGQTPIKVVSEFYNNWNALSKLSRFDDSKAHNLECLLNSYAEGGDDCENKSLIALPREFQAETAKKGNVQPGVSLGPYMRFFEEFIEENSVKMFFDLPISIASIKSIGISSKDSETKPAYYCFVVPKKYVWTNGNSRMLNDTVWVKSSCNRISGVRNEFGGSRQVSYNDTISTTTFANYSASELEMSAINLYYAGKYKEAFKIFKELSLRNYANLSSQVYFSSLIEEDRTYGFSKKFAENLMFWLAAKNINVKDENLNTVVHLCLFKYTDNKKHRAVFNPDFSYVPLTDDFPYGKDNRKINLLVSYERPISCGMMLTMNSNDNHQMGYMSESGKMIIPYKYKQAHSFSKEGLALVTENNIQWKFIDTKGNDAMPFTFDSAIHEFSNGLTYLTKNGFAMLVNTKGEIIKKIQGYKRVSPFLSLSNYALLFKDHTMNFPCDVYDFNGNLILENCDGYLTNNETGEISILKNKDIKLIDKINW